MLSAWCDIPVLHMTFHRHFIHLLAVRVQWSLELPLFAEKASVLRLLQLHLHMEPWDLAQAASVTVRLYAFIQKIQIGWIFMAIQIHKYTVNVQISLRHTTNAACLATVSPAKRYSWCCQLAIYRLVLVKQKGWNDSLSTFVSFNPLPFDLISKQDA